MSNTRSRPEPRRFRKAFSVVIALTVLVMLCIGVGLFGCANIDNAMQGSATLNTPPATGMTPASTMAAKTCYQLVPRISVDLGPADLNDTPAPGAGPDATMDPLPRYGYCAVAFKNKPWRHTVTSQLPSGTVACVFYEQTPDLAASNRLVAVYSVGDAFTIDVVKGSYSDGKPFTATPRVVILYVPVNQSLQPKELPTELSQLGPLIQEDYSEVVAAATSPLLGLPATYSDVQSALQVPGWK